MSKGNEQTVNTPPPLRPGGAQRLRGPVVKPKNFKGTLKRLWEYFGNERKMLALIFFFIIVDAVLMLLAPYLIGRAIDAMSIKNGKVNFNLLEVTVIVLTIAYIADAGLTFLQGWLMAGVAQRVVNVFVKRYFGSCKSSLYPFSTRELMVN
jgi:ATP-binding cassette subfamily B multidrug efflux pump